MSFTSTIFPKADIIFTPVPPRVRMDRGHMVQALSWEHLTVQPRHHRAWCDQAHICRHMNTASGMSHQYGLLCVKCGASHTVAGQTCIWASCGDIGCWHHNLLVTAGALLWLWVGCCEWDKYSDTDQRSAPTLHLVHTSFLLCS